MGPLEQQMRHRDREMVPRILVQAMFALMAGTLAIVAYAQWFDVPDRGVLDAAPIAEQRHVVLQGDRSGLYTVTDVASGTVIATSADDLAGFIGVMGRAIDRERLVHDVTSNAPITIARRENGNIAILDDTTGMAVELIGYGPDNVAAFANLLN